LSLLTRRPVPTDPHGHSSTTSHEPAGQPLEVNDTLSRFSTISDNSRVWQEGDRGRKQGRGSFVREAERERGTAAADTNQVPVSIPDHEWISSSPGVIT
jgi:hypothetical protein